MSYDVNNIIPINLILTPSGLGFADFSTAFIFVNSDDLLDPYFAVDTYRDYNEISEVAEDFGTTSDAYYMALRWFSQTPKPTSISIWLWDDVADLPAAVAAKADAAAWRYWYFFPKSVTDVEANAVALSNFCEASVHAYGQIVSDAEAIDPQDDTDLISVLQALGNRRTFVGYKDPGSITTDPSQAYSIIQLAAAFHKFRPEGFRTAITGEYQVLPGVIGDDLEPTAYNALKAKNGIFFTKIELQGSTDNSRVINSKSMSSFGEFMDDVINLDVLTNRLQVDGYNYIANAGTKRPLTPRGYNGLLSELSDTCYRFFQNGVLGEAQYIDPLDGEEKLAKYGYVIFSKPEDVFSLSTAQRRAREFPDTTILAILARAGHTAAITVNVE